LYGYGSRTQRLEAKNYRDFTVDSRYPQAFTELLADLHARDGVILKPEFRETSYVTVPPLPVNFVERPEALVALRDAVITHDGGRHVALTALQGMGGIGKTVLAQSRVVNSRRERGDSARNGSMSLTCQMSSTTIRAALLRIVFR
jgi:hypothetical protein